MSKKSEKNEVVPVNVFFCCDQEFTQKEVISHLKEVHSVDTSKPATRRMTSHIDGRDFYGSTYEWTFGDLKVKQSVSNPRAKNDPMRFD
jgi:hypothetical protein